MLLLPLADHVIAVAVVLYILCVVLKLLNIFYILATRSAFLVHGVILGSIIFFIFLFILDVIWVKVGSDFFSFTTGCHGNYRSIVSLP